MAEGLGDPISGIINFITGLFGSDQVYIWKAIDGGMRYPFTSMAGIEGFLSKTLDSIKSVFKTLWDNIVKAVLVKLIAAYAKLRELIHRIFDPVIRIIKRIREIYDSYFNKFVKPMLKVIRQMRQILTIFRLLGFKWAKRLDADLALIEQKIAEAYTTLRKYLNLAVTWIDLIVDPLGILRRNPLFASIIRSAPELQNVLNGVTQRPLTPQEEDSAKEDRGRYTLAQQRANFQSYYSQGKLPPCIEESRARFLVELKAIQNG